MLCRVFTDPELCGGKRCHMNARCHKNRCRCDKGMVGDGVETCYCKLPEEKIRCIFDDNWEILFVKSS